MRHLGQSPRCEEKFKCAVMFLRLVLPSTLIRHENGAILKRSLNRRNLKTSALRFHETENSLKTKLYENDDVAIIT